MTRLETALAKRPVQLWAGFLLWFAKQGKPRSVSTALRRGGC